MALNVERGTSSRVRPALPSLDFYDPGIFELERERIFFRNWICVGRAEELPDARSFLVRDLMGESLLLVRDRASRIRAFYNVCRHRGSRLCSKEAGHLPGVIQCPYHAWTYSLEGQLVGTPNVSPADGLDRADYPLHAIALETWEGFLFVNLAEDPRPLSEQLKPDGMAYARYRIGDLRLGKLDRYEVAANWKIIVENYNECLHCPTIHPELCELMPLYQRGLVVEDDGSLGNRLPPGTSTWTRTGTSKVPPLPGLTEDDLHMYWGFVVFPNMFVNLLPDHVTYEILWPVSPDVTKVTYGFLLHPGPMSQPGFDASDIYEFRDLILRQDLAVCELAHKGVRSRAFDHGVLPPQDEQVYAFEQQYVRERDAP